MYQLYVFLMVLLFLLGPVQSKAEEKFRYSGQGYKLELHDFPDRQVVVFNGNIDPLDGAGPLKDMLKKLVQGKDTILMTGISGGGEAKVYEYFGVALRNACPKGECKLTTYVHRYCASACVWLHMYGDERLSSSDAVFGFHRAYIGALGIQLVVQSKEDWAKRFIAFGADPAWIKANTKAILKHQKAAVHAKPDQMIRANILHATDFTFVYRALPMNFPADFYYNVVLDEKTKWLQEVPVAGRPLPRMSVAAEVVDPR